MGFAIHVIVNVRCHVHLTTDYKLVFCLNYHRFMGFILLFVLAK